MKKKLLLIAGCSVSVLLLGAVTIAAIDQTLIEPKTISSWSDLYSAYNSRPGLPPLPDFEPLTVYKLIQSKDWSFMTASNHWFKMESGETLYVAKDSKELGHLKLPLTIRIYNYLPTGETYILSSQDGETFQSEAAFTSEPLTNELFSELTEDEQAHELLFSIWRTRTTWEITLKSEDAAWEDLLNVRQTSLSVTDAQAGMPAPQSMMMSAPPEFTNNVWLCIKGSGEDQTLNVFAPESLSNIEVFSTSNLCSGLWTLIATNLNPAGPTNPATVAIGGLAVQHYRARTWGDEDEDGLSDGEELYVYKTSLTNSDSDGDAYTDYEEVYVTFTDPGNADISPPLVGLIKPSDTCVLIP